MRRLWIIFLCSMVWAAFSKVQGENFVPYSLFPLSHLKIIWPFYLWNVCINIVPIAYLWTLYSQESEYPKHIKFAAWIVTGKLADFMLEYNQGWFSISNYAVSYDTFLFLGLGMVLINAYVWKSSI